MSLAFAPLSRLPLALLLAVVTPAAVFFVARTLLRRSTPDAGAIEKL